MGASLAVAVAQARLVRAGRGLETCRWLTHECFALFLSIDKVLGMLGLL